MNNKMTIRKELRKIRKHSLKLRAYFTNQELANELLPKVINSLKVLNSFNEEKEKIFTKKLVNKKLNKYLTYVLFFNEEYFNEFNKIIDYKTLDNEEFIRFFQHINYFFDYHVLNHEVIRNIFKFYMYEKDDDLIKGKMNSLCYNIKHDYEHKENNNSAWFINNEEVKEEVLNEYFEYNNYIIKEKTKKQEEIKEKKKREDEEKYKNDILDINKPIEIDTKYRIDYNINFLHVFEDFGGRYGTRIVVDKRKNLDFNNYHLLVKQIAMENNIYALFQYLRLVISGQYKHVKKLDDVIKHMMNMKHTLLLETVPYGKKSCYVYMCEFLMYQFGIGYEKDTNKARMYLLENAFFISKCMLREHTSLSKEIVKALYQYYEDEQFYPEYKHILDYDFFNNFGMPMYVNLHYDYETMSWILKRLKKQGKDYQIGLLLNALDSRNKNAFREEYGKQQDVLNESIQKEKEEQERIKRENLEKKEKEKEERRLIFEKRLENLKKFNSSIQEDEKYNVSIDELKKMEDDPKAMVKVARYYFDLGGDEHKVNYLNAMRYYNLAVEAGDKFQLINIGISYLNLSNNTEEGKEYHSKALKIFLDNYKEHYLFALYYMIESSYLEKKNHDEMYEYYKNNENQTIVKIITMAYLFAQGKTLESFKIYNEVKEKWVNTASVDEYMMAFIRSYSNIYEKRKEELEIDNEAIKDEIIYAYKLGCNHVGLKYAELLYNGNEPHAYKKTKIFDQDYQKAYQILDSLRNSFDSSKEYYEDIMNKISEKLKGKI